MAKRAAAAAKVGRVQGLQFRIHDSEFRAHSLGYGFRIQSLELRVQDSGFRV